MDNYLTLLYRKYLQQVDIEENRNEKLNLYQDFKPEDKNRLEAELDFCRVCIRDYADLIEGYLKAAYQKKN